MGKPRGWGRKVLAPVAGSSMITRRLPFKAPWLILALACFVPAAWAGEGSIIPIGCANPDHCGVPPPNSGFRAVATGTYHTMGLRSDATFNGLQTSPH